MSESLKTAILYFDGVKYEATLTEIEDDVLGENRLVVVQDGLRDTYFLDLDENSSGVDPNDDDDDVPYDDSYEDSDEPYDEDTTEL
jgi:hypothetical protein